MASSNCLLARAIPLPAKKVETDQIDLLAAQLDAAVKLDKEAEKKPEKSASDRKQREKECISPADHLALQSLRSSALARKTNTTAKFSRDCRKLFADLLHGDDQPKGEEAISVKKEEEEEKKPEEKDAEKENSDEQKDEEKKADKEDGELIPRGPIRVYMDHGVAHHQFHPYGGHYTGHEAPMLPFNAAAPQSTVLDQSSLNPVNPYGYGYDCGLPSNWSCSNWSGRDSVVSTPSSTPDTTVQEHLLMSPGGRSELPDDLSDFILEYSRRYSPILSRKGSYSDGGSPRSSAADSPCGGESPLSAPQSSPAAPRGGAIGCGARTPPSTLPAMTITKQGSTDLSSRVAKERLRAMIRGEDMDEAWAWTCKCIQRHPGALTFQDADRDTLLHIVTSHMDMAKIYALVEQMLKMEVRQGEPLAFDMPNGVGETPLMVAVQKKQCEVVDYLLEAGASPNAQSARLDRDAPLHYAATRGMTPIVRVLCADPRTNLDAQNGKGLTPLLCAFKSHGVLEEESQSPVCTLEAAECLLKTGADPMLADVTNGRTLMHYAVERGDERLIELLRTHMNEQRLSQLVNQTNFCGETPMDTLEAMSEDALSEDQRARICLTLMTCGADVGGKQN